MSNCGENWIRVGHIVLVIIRNELLLPITPPSFNCVFIYLYSRTVQLQRHLYSCKVQGRRTLLCGNNISGDGFLTDCICIRIRNKHCRNFSYEDLATAYFYLRIYCTFVVLYGSTKTVRRSVRMTFLLYGWKRNYILLIISVCLYWLAVLFLAVFCFFIAVLIIKFLFFPLLIWCNALSAYYVKF